MTWALLDDAFYAHPKVVEAGNAGAGLYARALSYCGAHLTDGFVPGGWAREAGGATLCRKLEQVGLWRKEEGGYRIPDYTSFNPPREVVLARRSELSKKRSEAGKKGAEARWSNSKAYGNGDGKPPSNGMPPKPLAPIPIPQEDGPSHVEGEEEHGYKAIAVTQLLVVLSDATPRTKELVWALCARLPVPSIHKVRESTLSAVEQGRIASSVSGFAVNALKDEAREVAYRHG